MSFYATLGVPEVWVVDRDTRAPQVLRLVQGAYEKALADADGWVRSSITGVWLLAEPEAKLAMQMADDSATWRLLPGD